MRRQNHINAKSNTTENTSDEKDNPDSTKKINTFMTEAVII